MAKNNRLENSFMNQQAAQKKLQEQIDMLKKKMRENKVKTDAKSQKIRTSTCIIIGSAIPVALDTTFNREAAKRFHDWLKDFLTKHIDEVPADFKGKNFLLDEDKLNDSNENKTTSYFDNEEILASENHSIGNQDLSNRCSDCGTTVTDNVSDYSIRYYGRCLCMNCQKKDINS